MQRLFEDFSRDFGWSPPALGGIAKAPRLDVSESGDELKIEAELPGVMIVLFLFLLLLLFLTFDRKPAVAQHDLQVLFLLIERSYGSFARSLVLPFEADPEKASFAKGVLTVTIPKPPEIKAKEKKVPIS
jgi:HSP20 family protein